MRFLIILASAVLIFQSTAAAAETICPADQRALAQFLAAQTEVKRKSDGMSLRTYAAKGPMLGRSVTSIFSAWLNEEPTDLEILMTGDARDVQTRFKSALPGKTVACRADSSGECNWKHPNHLNAAKKELVEAQLINTFFGPPGTRIRCGYR